MPKDQDQFQSLRSSRSLPELRSRIRSTEANLTLVQARLLVSHAEELQAGASELRIGVVHTYTSNLLDTWIEFAAAIEGFKASIYHAPYGVVIQEAGLTSGLVAHKPDLTLLLLRREDLYPSRLGPISSLNADEQVKLSHEMAANLLRIARKFRELQIGLLVVTILPTMDGSELGIYDAHSERSVGGWWASVKWAAAKALRESVDASIFLDLDDVKMDVGRGGFFDPRLWYTARFPFGTPAAREIARRVIAVGVASKQPKAKVIVLDADNTLWGGIIGEDGLHGISLGPDYPGNVFVDFQARLLAYQQRGFVLALCSKNNPADVDQVLKNHPHQVLKEEHFAARRVNWLPKTDNLRSLATELNLGLDSFVFVDDSDHECALVRRELPEIEVVQTPTRVLQIPSCLDKLARLEVLSITAEDHSKTDLYAQERRRRTFQEQRTNDSLHAEDHLASLQMRMQIGIDCPSQIPRLAQLTQKTNQFNLTTRRYSEQQIRDFVESTDWMVAHFSLNDIFGNSGVVGLAILQKRNHTDLELNSFLMSCRVIGRGAESAFLHALLRRLVTDGVARVIGVFSPTPKNSIAAQFLAQQGFQSIGDNKLLFDFAETSPMPGSAFKIAVEYESGIT